MKDAQGDPAYGRTNWRRFAIAAVAPTVVAVGLVAGVASGAIAASFSVSGEQFKLSATRLEGEGFTQYSGQLKRENVSPRTGQKYEVAAMSGINSAKIYDLCQSVAVSGVVLRIEAGGNNNPALADDLVIGMSELSGDATFKDINIGQDASTLDADGRPAGQHGEVNGFGQQARTVNIVGLRQKAYSTTASTFQLKGMNLKLFLGQPDKECFAG